MKRYFTIVALLLSSSLIAKVGFEIGGQGVAYYQTSNALNNHFFSKESSQGSLGLQLNLNAKVDNGFALGYEGTFLGTLGLEERFISNARQYAKANRLNDYATTQIYLLRHLEQGHIKLGRQKLTPEQSPLAFSEDWNLFENSFEALIWEQHSGDKGDLTVGYISKANSHENLAGFYDITNRANRVDKGVYFSTWRNELFKVLPIRLSYYFLDDINGLDNGSALWFDLKVNHYPIKLAFQAGHIEPSNGLNSTSIFGVQASKSYDTFSFSLAYSIVGSGSFSFQNFSASNDSPLYTQMINNQDFISLDSQTTLFKVSRAIGKGLLTLQYGMSKDNSVNKNDFSELDLVYKFDWLATKMFVGYIGQRTDKAYFLGERDSHNLRFWTRYNF